ncbi:MAG: twitching motility protein PilT [Acidimicrobiia bacterium]
MTVVYDAGVFVAADRSDRRVWAEHRVRLELGVVPTTTAPVVAQVSRSPHQVQLRRFLRGCAVVAFDADQAHPVGAFLASAGTADVVDAHLAIVAAQTGSTVLTSDPIDMRHLSSHLASPLTIEPI